MSRKFIAETHFCQAECGCNAVSRRSVFAGAALIGASGFAFNARADETSVNLAKVATPSTSYNSGDTRVAAPAMSPSPTPCRRKPRPPSRRPAPMCGN